MLVTLVWSRLYLCCWQTYHFGSTSPFGQDSSMPLFHIVLHHYKHKGFITYTEEFIKGMRTALACIFHQSTVVPTSGSDYFWSEPVEESNIVGHVLPHSQQEGFVVLWKQTIHKELGDNSVFLLWAGKKKKIFACRNNRCCSENGNTHDNRLQTTYLCMKSSCPWWHCSEHPCVSWRPRDEPKPTSLLHPSSRLSRSESNSLTRFYTQSYRLCQRCHARLCQGTLPLGRSSPLHSSGLGIAGLVPIALSSSYQSKGQVFDL